MRHRFTQYAFLLLGIVLIISLVACAGPLEQGLQTASDVQWYQTFGGGDYDQGRSVQQTTEGGYIVCGITMSYGAGSEDVWLIKTDADGNKLWDKTFGGKEIDVGVSAQQTTDGGYIVCGSTFSYRGDSEDIWLIKTDADGNKLWDKAFGGEGTHAGRSVQQTVDGGYIVCGITKSSGADNAGVRMKNTNARLIKTDAEGNKLWDKAFSSGQGEIAATSVKQTTDGGYILCGESGSYESLKANVWLMKTDAEGNKLWDKTFGGEELAFADSVRQTTDGGYILCGVAGSYQTGKTKVWLIKTDLEGNKLWDKKFGGGGIAMGESIQQTTDGGYIMCGQTTSYQTGKTQALLIKVDANGNELWDKTFEGELAAEGYSVQQMADGGYIVCGTTKSLGSEGSKVLLYKIAPEQ